MNKVTIELSNVKLRRFWGLLCKAEAVNVEMVAKIYELTVKAAGGKECEGEGWVHEPRLPSARN